MSFSTHNLVAVSSVTFGKIHPFERTDSFSLSIWFKTVYTFNADTSLIEKRGSFSAYTGYRFYLWGATTGAGSGSLAFELVNNDSTANSLRVRGSTTVNDGRWYHGLVTYNGGNLPSSIELYLNGVAETKTTITNALSGSILNTGQFIIGYTGTLTYADEVAVYNRALTAAEASWIYNGKVPRDLLGAGSPSGLLSWWRGGEEGESHPIALDTAVSVYFPTMPDLSGSMFHGTMTNMTLSNIVADAPGAAGTYTNRSCKFNGTNEYISMGNVLDFERTNTFSFSCWFKTTTDGIILSKQANAVPSGYVVRILGGKVRFELINTPTTYALVVETTSATWADGKWHLLTVTYAGTSLPSGVIIYIDTSDQSRTTVTNTLTTGSTLNGAPFYIGDRQLDQGTSPFNGYIDEVAVYNIVLSSSQVWWMMNITIVEGSQIYTPRRLDISGAPPVANLIGWWAMGEGRPGYYGSNSRSSRGNLQGAEATLVSFGSGGTPGPSFMYLKRARDLGSGAVYIEWTSTDANSVPPTPPPVGPWGEIVVISKWLI